MNIVNFDAERTMTSREIAELTGKKHKHVLREIENMLDELGLSCCDFAFALPDSHGRLKPCFHLPYRECMILVTGYGSPMLERVVDRWEALETGIVERWDDLEAVPAVPAAVPTNRAAEDMVVLSALADALPPTPMQLAISDMQAWKDAAAIFRVPESLALVEGVKHVAISYSIDFQPLLLASPAMDDIQDKM